jgi:Flp pilus assembly protein TadD
MTTTLTFKKTITILATTSIALSLAACGKQAKTPHKTTTATITATVTLDFDNDKKADESKKITLDKDQSLLDALKANFKVDEKDGFITAIDDHAQDATANKYWLFDINGKLADKGAADIQLKKGDEVAFYLGNF